MAPDTQHEEPNGGCRMKTIAVTPETMQARIARFAELGK
jgi:hypothetical protein